MAVTVGFEPTVEGCSTRLFESRTFGRSDTSPSSSLWEIRLVRELPRERQDASPVTLVT